MNLSNLICQLVAPTKKKSSRSSIGNDLSSNQTIVAMCKLDDSLLIQLKRIMRNGTVAEINEVYHYLSIELSNRSNVVRLRTLVVIDHFIHRSKYFRQLIFNNIRTIAQSTGLMNNKTTHHSNTITPHSSELLEKGKELLEVWDHLFGAKNPQLHALARYCRESLNLEMPNIIVSLCSDAVILQSY